MPKAWISQLLKELLSNRVNKRVLVSKTAPFFNKKRIIDPQLDRGVLQVL